MKISALLRRAGAALAALAIAVILPSCFESHTTVKVNKDGSGTIDNKIIMSAQMAGMMNAAAAQEGAEVKNPLTDEAQYKDNVKKMGEGVEFVGLKPLKFEDGRQGVVVSYKYADIRKLKLEPGEAGPPGGEEADEEKAEAAAPIVFDFTPGDKAKLSVKMPPPAKPEVKAEEKKEEKKAEDGEPNVAEGGGDQEAAAMAMMAPMMQGMRVSMVVETVGNISETNATFRDGNKVTLMDIDFGKLMANPEFAKKLKSPDDMKDFAKFSAMAKDAGANIEAKPEVTVTFE